MRTLHDLASFNLIRIYIRVPRFVYSQSVWFGPRPGHALEYQNGAPGEPFPGLTPGATICTQVVERANYPSILDSLLTTPTCVQLGAPGVSVFIPAEGKTRALTEIR